MAKKGVSPEINAISALMFLVVIILLLIVNLRQVKEEKKLAKRKL